MTTDVYEDLRPLMFSIAYRMLGSVSEAEDVVQEAFLRLHRERGQVESPKAWLSTTTTRLAIDQLRSARARRETYVGEWLPEPLLTSGDETSRHAEVADSLSTAFLVLLESLSPVERAVFLLREVFDYPYDQIAAIVDKSQDNVRQLAVRARRHVDERRLRFDASREERDELARKFFAAAEEGDLEGLEALLAEDVVLHGDGGGKAPALARPIHGRERVAKVLLGWVRQMAGFDLDMRIVEVNGQPGAMTLDTEGAIVNVMSLDVAEGRIQGINSIVNPDKLDHLGPVADVRALLRSVSERRRSG
ncbi:MAG TPA: RNA polymerase sigma-70 factor [Thermoleophilaceae bacterium]